MELPVISIPPPAPSLWDGRACGCSENFSLPLVSLGWWRGGKWQVGAGGQGEGPGKLGPPPAGCWSSVPRSLAMPAWTGLGVGLREIQASIAQFPRNRGVCVQEDSCSPRGSAVAGVTHLIPAWSLSPALVSEDMGQLGSGCVPMGAVYTTHTDVSLSVHLCKHTCLFPGSGARGSVSTAPWLGVSASLALTPVVASLLVPPRQASPV